MIPITPKGTLIRFIFSPLGITPCFCTRPIGEGNLATLRMSSAMPFKRSAVSIKRSYFGLEISIRSRSFRFSARINSVLSSAASATASNIWLIFSSFSANSLRLAYCTAEKVFFKSIFCDLLIDTSANVVIIIGINRTYSI